MRNHTRSATGAFSPDELMPRSGNPGPEPTRPCPAVLQARNATFRSIFVHNPNHVRVFQALDEVIALGSKGTYQTGVRNAADSYAGKSASADEFERIFLARGVHSPGTRPVVRVELEQACTARRFWSTILEAYGDGFARSKEEPQLRRSAYEAFERFGTVLLTIDEVQHAGCRSKGFSAPTDIIKRFISDAQVGLALFGNLDARTLLESNNQLSHRLLPPCDIQPLDLSDPTDQHRFRTFLRRYDKELVAKGLFRSLSGFDDARVSECLMAISGGYVGRVVTLIGVAARQAFLRGADAVDPFDLSHACATWAVGQKLTRHDPFRYGTGIAHA